MYTLVIDYEDHDFKILEYGEIVAYRRFAIQDTADKTPEEALRYPEVQAQQMTLGRLVDLANMGLAEVLGPMSPDYPTLSQHEPQSQVADSRAAAGLDGGGDPLELTPEDADPLAYATYV